MGEGGIRVHVEDRERIFPILYTPLHEDHADEVDTGAVEEGERGRFGEVLNVHYADVADDVGSVVDHSEGTEAFGVHEEEGFG